MNEENRFKPTKEQRDWLNEAKRDVEEAYRRYSELSEEEKRKIQEKYRHLRKKMNS